MGARLLLCNSWQCNKRNNPKVYWKSNKTGR